MTTTEHDDDLSERLDRAEARMEELKRDVERALDLVRQREVAR